jgi:hypothetical protein
MFLTGCCLFYFLKTFLKICNNNNNNNNNNKLTAQFDCSCHTFFYIIVILRGGPLNVVHELDILLFPFFRTDSGSQFVNQFE